MRVEINKMLMRLNAGGSILDKADIERNNGSYNPRNGKSAVIWDEELLLAEDKGEV